MANLQKGRSKATFLSIVGTAFVTILITTFVTHYWSTAPKAECKNPGLSVPATLTLDGFVRESKVIARGKVKSINNSEVTITVSEIISGRGLKHGESIILCPSQVNPTRIETGNDVLLFLKGKDSDVWVLTWPYDSIMVIDNGRAETEENTFSLDEVRKAIKDQK